MSRGGSSPDARRRAYITEEGSCLGKIPYDSANAAAIANTAMKTKSRGKNKGNGNHIYRCEFCHKWHIGRVLKKRRFSRTQQNFAYLADE